MLHLFHLRQEWKGFWISIGVRKRNAPPSLLNHDWLQSTERGRGRLLQANVYKQCQIFKGVSCTWNGLHQLHLQSLSAVFQGLIHKNITLLNVPIEILCQSVIFYSGWDTAAKIQNPPEIKKEMEGRQNARWSRKETTRRRPQVTRTGTTIHRPLHLLSHFTAGVRHL